MGLIPSPQQRMCWQAFLRACLPHIYKEEWPVRAPDVMQELDIDCIRYEVLVQAPRRIGKTVSIAMFVLAIMLNVPGIRICIFSTGKRASSSLMATIMQLLQGMDGGVDRIVKKNEEQLFLATCDLKQIQLNEVNKARLATDPSTSKLFSFPSGTASKLYIHRQSCVSFLWSRKVLFFSFVFQVRFFMCFSVVDIHVYHLDE